MREREGGRVWQLHVAKAKFSELFTMAVERGPQRVSRHGKDEVVVVAAKEFDRLAAGEAKPKQTAFDVLRPLMGSGLTVKRSNERGRALDL